VTLKNSKWIAQYFSEGIYVFTRENKFIKLINVEKIPNIADEEFKKIP
jgi:hypothetical protein